MTCGLAATAPITIVMQYSRVQNPSPHSPSQHHDLEHRAFGDDADLTECDSSDMATAALDQQGHDQHPRHRYAIDGTGHDEQEYLDHQKPAVIKSELEMACTSALHSTVCSRRSLNATDMDDRCNELRAVRHNDKDEPQPQEEDQQHKNEAHRRELQLWRSSNVGIPLCFLYVGLVQGLLYPLINVYPLQLNASEAQQATIWLLKGLPSCFKIFFGFLSDNVPICGYRRKPYMFIGWTISCISMLSLLLLSDLTLERQAQASLNATQSFDDAEMRDADDAATMPIAAHELVIVPPNAPSMPLLCVTVFIWAMGIWLADVMGDSLIAEKAKYEPKDQRGNLQVLCYLCRGIGMGVTTPISALCYNLPSGPQWIITAIACLPITLIPFLYNLHDRNVHRDAAGADGFGTFHQRLQSLWHTACSHSVYQPMAFVYIYVVSYVYNDAWKQFLTSVLLFTPNQLNALTFAAGIMTCVGVVLYKCVLYRYSWRYMFLAGIWINGVFSLLQLLLIAGKASFLFALGDEGVRDFVLGSQYIPFCVLMVNLVPSNIEGASYALFTTTWNVADSLCESLSTMLLGIWDVSKPALEAGDLSGLTKLTVLTSALQLLPLLVIGYMPHSVDDLLGKQRGYERAPTKDSDGFLDEDVDVGIDTSASAKVDHNDAGTDASQSSRSTMGGVLYLGGTFLSLLLAIFIGVMNIIQPGWMGES